MSLLIQLRSLLYFFLMGIGYSFILAYVLCILQTIKTTWIRNIIELWMHISFTLVLYFGLIHVNQGIIHIYFIVSLMIGFFGGMFIFQPIILPYAMRLRYKIEKQIKRYKQLMLKRKQQKKERKRLKEAVSEEDTQKNLSS